MDRYITWVLAHPRKVIGILLCVVILFGYFGFSVKMDNSMEVWLSSHDPKLADYHQFLKDFGSAEFILIAFEQKAGFTQDQMFLTKRLTQALEREEGVEKVLSLAQLYDQSGLDFKSFRKAVMASPLYRNNLISSDGKVTAILLQLSQEGLRDRQGLVNRVRELVSFLSSKDEKIFLAGPPVFNVELDQMSQRVSAHYFPLLFCVALIILFFLFRSVVGVLLPAMMMVLCLLLTIGWMGIWGGSLNMVTVALFPLVMVISLAYSIYLLNAYHYNIKAKGIKISSDQRKEIIASSFKEVRFPIFLSAITTGIGFGSLMVSEVTPVKDLGFFAALSISSAFLLVISFLPSALYLFPLPSVTFEKKGESKELQRFFQGLALFAERRKHLILTFCLILFLASLSGITQLKVETNALEFFQKKNQLAQAYAFIEDNLTGLSPIEIVIESKKGQGRDQLLSEETLGKIKSLQEFLSHQEGVVSSQSVVNMLEGGIVNIKQGSALQGYLNQKENATRVSVKAKTLGSSEYQLLIKKINDYLKANFVEGLRAYTTGIVPLIVDMQDSLLKNLIQSFSLAFGVIGLILFFLLRSLKNTLISMIPNIIPIVVILGFMGWAGIKLDVATIMIASIALGIAVDDTIHFIFRFKKEQSASEEYAQPIMSTLSSTGKAIIFTSLVNFCGFFVLCFSDFKPMIYFGLLTGITIIAALIGDLIVLPAALVAFKVKLN